MKTCTIKTLLCWCIYLFISNAVAGGGWLVAGVQAQIPKAEGQLPTDHRPPATSHQLPCLNSSPTCLTTLSHLAVQNSREIALLEKAIQLQKKKLWTSWLSADGLNPLAIGLRIARNVAGGGERAALKLEIARLELRRAELETNLRQALLQSLLSDENARQQVELAQARLAAQHLRVALSEIGYRFGMGTTPEMLQEWERRDELHGASLSAERSAKQTLHQLEAIVYTSEPRP